MIKTRTPRYTRVGLELARDYENCLTNMCRHVSNDDYYGRPFALEEFQRENIWKPILGAGKLDSTGRFVRKYRRAIIGLPSGFGKTELAAALLLTIATMEPIHNGQYGIVASSLDQVKNLYEKIATMIRLNPTWNAQWQILKGVIIHRETGAKIMVFPNKADALESWHLNVVIFDEVHTYKDNSVWNSGTKGQKVLFNSLAIAITTAGDKREGFLWDLLQKAPDDPGMYVYWLGLNDNDNINRKASWRKLLVAPWVTWESIQDQRASAASLASFERYTGNRFPQKAGEKSLFTDRQIGSCSRKANGFDPSKPFVLGIDGAVSGDSFAIVAYQEDADEDTGETIGYTREWVFDEPPEETGIYDQEQIAELVANICAENYPYEIGLDPARLIVFGNTLANKYGLDTTAYAQTNAIMCQASALVISGVKHRTLRLRGCPKLQQHLKNTVELEREPYGVRFGKDKQKRKIDAAIALAIAELSWRNVFA